MVRVVLEIGDGPLAGRRWYVDDGAEVIVGRAEDAGLTIPDEAMSIVHFALRRDGAVARLRDLGSLGGTQIDGEAVEGGAPVPVGHGAIVTAGETRFRVEIRRPLPAPQMPRAFARRLAAGLVPPALERVMRETFAGEAAPLPAHLAAVEAGLRGAPGRLYAVLDAARAPRVLSLLGTTTERYESLYQGMAFQELGEVGPYLVELPPGAPLLAELLRAGWGRAFGIYLVTERPFAAVRRHLRRFLVVEDERGAEAFFRFYDPVVLRAFLPRATAAQRREMLEDAGAFWMEGDAGALLLGFTGDEDRLDVTRHAVAPAEAGAGGSAT